MGPLARMRINGFYNGGTSTMDRICARSLEAALVGTEIPRPEWTFTMLGRIIRAYAPCLACGTHMIDLKKDAPPSRLIE
ncbi:ni/fe-hydrogenase, large subunit domain protein, putative [Heliomicrobium modesticaldum Ice1]|uniref:Ni/fe-hydrogenase, large subunit domain protein, putative n=1 Tax=Heliobacterium modesticaldum (strain ATCC 51547 / Ice1) TaxID=498761 RepID=B0TIA2_HELMI|nr:ni/fe-hydrogenase large subunit domain protein [Heliomicrobium modesticaldum]ABZ83522.1 ni/fe-hydrogenase, large subunit domain protein, putative [Heliomicrobium modesticaldum Ice1]